MRFSWLFNVVMLILLKYNNIMNKNYPRDMVGYGSKKIKVTWPNNAKLALQVVLNYEEGAENSVLHGDKHSEIFLFQPWSYLITFSDKSCQG